MRHTFRAHHRESLSKPWFRGGISRCFLQTIGSIIAASWILFFGVIQLIRNRKRRQIAKRTWMPGKTWTRLQIFLSFLASLSNVLNIILHYLLTTPRSLHGYLVASRCLFALSWLFAIALIVHERNRVTPRHRRHGIALLGFYAIGLVVFLLSFAGWNNEAWFWLHVGRDRSRLIDMIFYFVHGGGLVAAFLLALTSPIYRASSHLLPPLLSENDVEEKDDSRSRSTYRDFLKKCKQIFPYVWPKNSGILQFAVILCFLLIIAGRVMNVFTPIFYKEIVNALDTPTNLNSSSYLTISIGGTLYYVSFPWRLICMYVFSRFLQGAGSMGVLNGLRGLLWIPVQQYTSRTIQVDLFKHLHNLSLRWHLSRKTGEVLRVMDRGTISINNILLYVLFNIVPTIGDIIIAIVYFVVAFNFWFGLIVFVTMALYLIATFVVTEWRTSFRRGMNDMDNETRQKAVDSLLNFETVKYYNAEAYEVDRFRESFGGFQAHERKSLASLTLLNSIQNVIISIGLLAGCLLCAKEVSQGNRSVGDFVLFVTYILQLYQPLNFFGNYYRFIQQAFIDMENMFELLAETQEVTDAYNALPLRIKHAGVFFNNVSFAYDTGSRGRQILKNVTFEAKPGQTIALVGPSGSGKSTIIRLLIRLYNLPSSSGVILIDGQDISQVTQSSLRTAIGVVPQDTVLFNDTIRYNVRYGKIEADDEGVEAAAIAADIHDRILVMPSGYKTVVGERGLKLSGGEKQRVAIARTILKSPAIVLLDEATSALDTRTERNIQASLAKVCSGRTSIVVAHRLSTIIHADQILVLSNGVIVERGRHAELLALNGMYADMWDEQLRAAATMDNEGNERDEIEADEMKMSETSC